MTDNDQFSGLLHTLDQLKACEPDTQNEPFVATDAVHLQQAWRLVNACYVNEGYSQQADALWYDAFFLDPRTTCLLTPGERPATLTVVFDSPLGLPAHRLFSQELDQLRHDGHQLCEFTAFAHANPQQRLDLSTIFALFRHAWLTATFLEKATDIIITVNPRHVPFYMRCLLFERCSDERSYAKVGGAPAVLLRLDLTTFEARCRQLLAGKHTTYFFHDDPQRSALLAHLFRQRHTPDPWVLAWFCRHHRDLISDLSPAQYQWVLQQHPSLAELLNQDHHNGTFARDSGRLLAAV